MNVIGNVENGILTVEFAGRLDSATSPEAERIIAEMCESMPHGSLVFDMQDVEYVSSAGLRILLHYRRIDKSLKVINVSSEVYDVLQMTGMTEMIAVERAFRRLDVSGCKVIGEGAKGVVYRYDDDTIVKVFKDSNVLSIIRRERELARRAFILGISTAISYDIVKVGDNYGAVYELLDNQSLSEIIAENPAEINSCVEAFTGLLRQLHTTEVTADAMPDVKELVNKWVSACVPYLSSEQNEKLKNLVDSTPDKLTMLHCDYHTRNVMMQNGEAIVIDMDTLCHGHPVFELANIYITYVAFGETDRTIVERFLGIDYDTSLKFWNLFLPEYLGTDDEAIIHNVAEKAMLMAYVRLMRHVSRRGISTDTDRANIALCTERITGLLEKVDTLDF